MKKVVIFVSVLIAVLLVSCQSTQTLDPDLPISIEIINMPEEYYGFHTVTFLFSSAPGADNTGAPQFVQLLDTSIYSGLLEYSNGDVLRIKNIQRNTFYTICLVYLYSGDPNVSKWSKKFQVKSDVIRLNYETDFVSTSAEAIRLFL